MPANLITLPHFSVSSAMSLPNSASQGVIDRLNEVGAEDELRVISKQLTRLVFRAQPFPRAASSPKNRSARHRAALSPS